MPVNSNNIEGLIETNLPDNTTRLNKASVVRYVLKAIVGWVRDAVNGNLTTWLRDSDNQPGGANADGVYRTGLVTFRGGAVARTVTPTNSSLAQVPFGNQSGLQFMGVNGGPAFMEFHLPGNRIDQLGVDTDGVLKLRPWGENVAYPLMVEGQTQAIKLGSSIANKKISLYDLLGNDHQFFGFGFNPGAVRYQVGDTNSSHVFCVGTSPATSNELMRVKGNGNVGIGMTAPAYRLDVGQDNPANGVLAQFYNSNAGALAGKTGSRIAIHQSGVSIWRLGQPPGVDAFVIEGFGTGNFPERLRIDTHGNVGIGTSAMTSLLHLNGVTGHQQFRLEKPYTPNGPNDPNGQPGQVAWDDAWFYLKTTNGWRRLILNSW